MSDRRAQALALQRRLLVAEAALQRARLRHELATVRAEASPATWLAQASRHWPWLSIAGSLLRRRSAPALAVSALVLAWRWWRRRRAR